MFKVVKRQNSDILTSLQFWSALQPILFLQKHCKMSWTLKIPWITLWCERGLCDNFLNIPYSLLCWRKAKREDNKGAKRPARKETTVSCRAPPWSASSNIVCCGCARSEVKVTHGLRMRIMLRTYVKTFNTLFIVAAVLDFFNGKNVIRSCNCSHTKKTRQSFIFP